MLPRSSRGYNSLILELYDFAILKLSSLLFWRCQSAQFITLYRSHVSRKHLEVGVGTGYLLKRAVFPSHTTVHFRQQSARVAARISTLITLQPNCCPV